MELYIGLLLQYQEHLSHLEKQIDALANEVKEYQIIRSIPGIAATVLSEIGETNWFNHAKKLVAFAGIDPSVYSSGKRQTESQNEGPSDYDMLYTLRFYTDLGVLEIKSVL